MSVQFLSHKEQKKSLSGQKKKKKKTKKNILSLPDKFDIKNPDLSNKNASALTSVLENLLPHAKLFQNSGKGNGENKSDKGPEETVMSENRLKRNQLLLGINVVSKGVQNNTAACVIIADDITPKLMTTHLKVLCSSKKVPYVSLPQFRVLTKRTLGFPCMALGIKKNSADFLPVIELVCSIMKGENYLLKTYSDNSVIEIDISKENNDVTRDETEKKEEPFAYLYRNVQNGKRAFVPDSHRDGAESTDKNRDFIALGVTNEKFDNAKETERGGTVESIRRQQSLDNRKRKRKEKLNSSAESETDFPVEYSAAKVMKLDSNPFREREKSKKLKQK